MTGNEIWSYRPSTGHVPGTDLIGFQVEAADGHIGKIDKQSEEVRGAYLVVDTGPWTFGKFVLLPARTVVRVDHDEQKVHVDRSKDEIKDGPELRSGPEVAAAYRDRFNLSYGPFYGPFV
ncbi:PRC-barrel domain-containing protein [Kitasatospora sp. NPDC002227]|uniref:PRC-barrel domain-containing protein n=1 Tax=Kitasatospora sp. NPDC002227 TaxID=3154773 RepID=UPI003326E2D2